MYKNQNNVCRIFVITGATLLEFLSSIMIIYLTSVAFGAYLIEDFLKTLLFSAFISSVSVMPMLILIEHKNPLDLLDRLIIRQDLNSKFESNLVNLSYGSAIGAWFGALVIPLDWDRWWQEWPISCCIGALIGAIIGVLKGFVKTGNKNKLHL